MENVKKVLVTATNYSRLCPEAKRLLENNGCEIIENKQGRPLTFAELERVVPDIDGVVAGVDAWNEAVFQLAPRLKVIARFGVGVDNIDLNKAHEYGIKVSNVPGGNSNAVAELALGLILSLLRNIPALNQSARRGEWNRFVGTELAGKTVGLLGFGSIAQMVAQKLLGFNVKLIAFDKAPNLHYARQYGVDMLAFEDVLRSSDVISMHLPSLPETYRIMGEKQFSMMKKSAYFVNTARGALVDEQALVHALQTGSIAGSALDVFEHEPVSAGDPLFQLDNLITTPHTAAETYETYRKVGLVTAQAILDVFAGKNPTHMLQNKT